MENISDRLTIEEHNGKQFIFLDFKGLKERDMIALDNAHMKLQLVNKLPFLADFHNTYVTPEFMSNTKRLIELHKGIIEKGAFLGIDKVKSWILKGVVLVYGCNLKAFDTKEQAKYFLTGEKKTNGGLFILRRVSRLVDSESRSDDSDGVKARIVLSQRV